MSRERGLALASAVAPEAEAPAASLEARAGRRRDSHGEQIRIGLQKRHGQWYAVALDYNVATAASEPERACRDALSGVGARLRYAAAAGAAERRAPRSMRFQSVVGAAVNRLFGGRAPDWVPDVRRVDLLAE